MVRFSMPAGTYYVGDPCYVFEQESWKNLCNQFDNGPRATLNGHEIIAFNTAYGDGWYEDNFNRDYAVDSGMIGVVPKEIVEVSDEETNFITFSHSFTVKNIKNGFLQFGHVLIETR